MLAAFVVGHQFDVGIARMTFQMGRRCLGHWRTRWTALDFSTFTETVLLAARQISRQIRPIIKIFAFVFTCAIVNASHTL